MSVTFKSFVFHAGKRALWSLARTQSCLLFFGEQVHYLSFKCAPLWQQSDPLFQIFVFTHLLCALDVCVGTEVTHLRLQRLLQVTAAARMVMWRISEMWYSIQASKLGGNGGKKENIATGSPLIALTAAVLTRPQDGKRLIVGSLPLIIPLLYTVRCHMVSVIERCARSRLSTRQLGHLWCVQVQVWMFGNVRLSG